MDRDTAEPHVRLTFIGNVMYGAGFFGNLLKAGSIDYANRPPAPAEPGVTADCGAYLVRFNSCRDRHGVQLAGGKSAEPSAPLAPSLTPGGELNAWTDAQFIRTLRTGVTPCGTQLRSRFMPWDYKGQMTDEELKAVWVYLASLPALPTSTGMAE